MGIIVGRVGAIVGLAIGAIDGRARIAPVGGMTLSTRRVPFRAPTDTCHGAVTVWYYVHLLQTATLRDTHTPTAINHR